MSELPRDPRTCPRPGDVLRIGKKNVLVIDHAGNLGVPIGDVLYYADGERLHCPVKAWRYWMAGAEVVYRAKEAPTQE
jgi:hypothetical protein